MNSPAEALDRFDSGLDLPVHTSAGVEQNPNTDGDILILAEMRDLLRLAVFFEDKIVNGQVWNTAASGVGDGCYDIHQSNIDAHLCTTDDRSENQNESGEAERTKAGSHVNSRAALYYVSA